MKWIANWISAHIVVALSFLILPLLVRADLWDPKVPGICKDPICFKSRVEEADFERQHNCVFGELCGGRVIKTATTCCGKSAVNGKEQPHDKYEKNLSDDSDWWSNYQKQCPSMVQSKAPPDQLWAQCQVGKKHSPSDDWVVAIVGKNGSARSYCIDGCSTPPGWVNAAYVAGRFIFEDKDNPTGKGVGGIGERSSFFNACANHDKCYQTCSTTNQAGCDAALLRDMLAVCASIPQNHETTFTNNLGLPDTANTRQKCEAAANTMDLGLRLGGKPAFTLRRHQYCQCCE